MDRDAPALQIPVRGIPSEAESILRRQRLDTIADSILGRQRLDIVALLERVEQSTETDADRSAKFIQDASGTWWSTAQVKRSKNRTLVAIKHAYLEDQWGAIARRIDAALIASPLSSMAAGPTSRHIRRAARWAALALLTRDLRDELTYGDIDYALLTFAWTMSIGAVHPADMLEDPWIAFSGKPVEPRSQVALTVARVSPTVSSPPVTAPDEYGLFHVRYWLGEDGKPISSEDDEAAWLTARRTGVGATDARMLVRANGVPSVQRAGLLQRKLDGDEGRYFAAFDNGVEREPIIARWVSENFAITHNSHLCMGRNPRHLATPDGIGDGVICEIKTSIDPLAKAVRRYRDQLQWQLHVTDSPRVLFVVENRYTREREYAWVGRDEERIATLVAHADDFLAELDACVEERRESTLRDFEPILIEPKRAVRFEESPAPKRSRPPVNRRVDTGLREWTATDSCRVVMAYAQGDSIAAISRTHGTEAADVVRELSRWLLVTEGEMVDETAGRFGLTWEQREREALSREYFQGVHLVLLAESMQRDQLGLAFQLFGARLPAVPNTLIQMLEVRANGESPALRNDRGGDG